MSSGRHYFALTNTHGWRLAIQASRVGIPPYSAAPALDASTLVAGFPLIAKGQPPRGVEGADGPVIALELVAARIPRPVLRELPGKPAHCYCSARSRLAPCGRCTSNGDRAARFPRGASHTRANLSASPCRSTSPSLFTDEWPAVEVPPGDVLELGRKWQRHPGPSRLAFQPHYWSVLQSPGMLTGATHVSPR